MQKKFQLLAGLLVLVISITLLNNLGVFDNFLQPEDSVSSEAEVASPHSIPATENKTPGSRPRKQQAWGLNLDSFELEKNRISRGETFGNILHKHGISHQKIYHIDKDFRDVFDVRRLRTGKPYELAFPKGDSGQSQTASHMVYHMDAVNYVVFSLGDSLNVERKSKEVTTRQRSISGRIESSLYETILDKGGSPALVMDLSSIYAWTIDFFRIKKGDYFKLIYEERLVDDSISVGSGRILACDFNHSGRSFYSFWYKPDNNYSDYFDEEGNTLRKAFLRAPLEFSRISSRYSPKRFHPVLKRWRSHLGTDYAAPRGTPIKATADGTVIAATYTRGNGNYVKIRHNATYTTQYLHMTRQAKGIQKGVAVKQGDVIGYVGSTGLATGPHVCYRFWVNGKQVDPYKQDLPEADPIKEEYREDYLEHMAELKTAIDALPLGTEASQVQLASAGS